MGEYIVEYKVIYNDDLYKLMKEVQTEIKKGWVPQGGVSAVPVSIVRTNEIKYLQAMVKHDKVI